MALVGVLKILMSTDTKPLKKGTDQAVGLLDKLKSHATLIKGALAGLGASVGIHVFAGMHKEAAAAIDVVAKLADRIGATTEGIVGLQHAAGLAGATEELLNKSLEKLGVNLAKAASDTGQAKTEFDQLGNVITGVATAASALRALDLDAKQLGSMDRVEAFKLLADRISAIEDPARRAATTVALFGEEGAKLGNLLMAGSKGIEAAQKEAEKLGKTYSRADAAKVEAANDAWSKLGAITTSVGNSIAITAAPAIIKVADSLVELQVAARPLMPVFEGIGMVIGATVIVTFEALKAAVWAVAKVFQFAQGAVTGLIGAVVKIGTLGQFGDEFLDEAGRLWELEGAASSLAPAAQAGFGAMASGAEAAAAKTKALAKEQSKLGQSVEALNKRLFEEVSTFGMGATQAEIYKLKLQGATEADLTLTRSLARQKAMLETVKDAQELKTKTMEDRQFAGISSEGRDVLKLAERGAPTDVLHSILSDLQATRGAEAGKAMRDQADSAMRALPGLVRQGSREAFDLELRARTGNVSDKNLKLGTDQLAELRLIRQAIARRDTAVGQGVELAHLED